VANNTVNKNSGKQLCRWVSDFFGMSPHDALLAQRKAQKKGGEERFKAGKKGTSGGGNPATPPEAAHKHLRSRTIYD